ncbi:MAG: ribbon-helix-helix protein, CopG family [Clostridiales bacterium]|nr:ribbon-helix-helix protein, CopG family [Clostridiales bacterium]
MDKKLIITSKKYRGETMVVSSRLKNELVEELDKIADKTGRTRNEIIQLCLEFAVDNLEIEEGKSNGTNN